MAADPHGHDTVRPVMPPTIEPETFGNDDVHDLIVYVPTSVEWDHDPANPPEVELRLINDETPAMLAYSTYERLTKRAGENQPYIEPQLSYVELWRHLLGADVVLWDVWVDPSMRHGILFGEEGDERGD